MKNLLTAVLLFITFMGCNTHKHISASRIGLLPLNNYFTKNTVALPEALNYKVINSNTAFNNTFGAAKTNSNVIITPDFKGQTVVAIIASSACELQPVKFVSADITGKYLNVYCVAEKKEDVTYNTIPAAIATLPKSLDVNKINFFINNEKVKTLPLVYDTETGAVTIKTADKKPAVKKAMRRPVMI